MTREPPPKAAEERFLQILTEAVDATRIYSLTRFTWLGEPSPRLRNSIRRMLSDEILRVNLVTELSARYYGWYTTGARHPSNPVPTPFTGLYGNRSFLRSLREANAGGGCWESGWHVADTDGPMVLARKGGLRVAVARDECRPHDGKLHVEAPIMVRFPREMCAYSPGFYMALGDRELDPDARGGVIRLYWNTTPQGAVDLVRRATRTLGDAGFAFQLKTIDTPVAYTRCDASVLYIGRSDYDSVHPLLEQLYAGLRVRLKPSVVLFCKALAPGLGLAESPYGDESFGMHRSRLIAEGMVRAYEERAGSPAARLEVLRSHMAESGVSSSEPHLNAGSTAAYPFGTFREGARRSGSHPSRNAPPVDPDSFLHAAAAVGRRFVERAIWWRNRCNWLGGDYFSTQGTSRAPRYSFRALGPNLYSGVAGVALFLAESFRVTGEVELREVALGAIRQAFATADLIPDAGRWGLYTGCTGIALAGVRLGLLFDDVTLLKHARRLVRGLTRQCEPAPEFDLLSGRAGALIGLLAIDRELDDPELVLHACRIGQGLIATADESDEGLSWRKPGEKQRQNLTGLSHGAAGVGYAFARLYERTREAAFKDAAEAAFRYEQQHFDSRAGNWKDLRKASFLHRSVEGGIPFSAAWCHGAPGIALSRLCAVQALARDAWEAQARVALATTANVVGEALPSGEYDCGLCHGMSGNADVLLHGALVFHDQAAEYQRLAASAADASARRFERGEPLCFDGQDGSSLSLMTGLAGFGYHQLRVHTPSVPSVLAF